MINMQTGHHAGSRVYESILELLPSPENPTPMVRINRITPYYHTKVYAKLEWYNPFGSIKDRTAAALIFNGEETGILTNGDRLVEPTSGNTGIGLAMVAHQRGYPLTTPVSRDIPEEKRNLLRLLDVDIEEVDDDLCPAPGATDGAIARAAELAGEPGTVMLNQYANHANPEIHCRTTGPEIWIQTNGQVTHFAAALGTCGTINGVGRFLKQQNPDVQIIGAHPTEGHDVPGVRSRSRLAQTEFFKPDLYDNLTEVDSDTAYKLTERLNTEESIPAGPSSGLALAGVFQTIPDAKGNIVVVVFPDSNAKYATSMARRNGTNPSSTSHARPVAELIDRIMENTGNNPGLTASIDAAATAIREDAFVIDVRTPTSYSRGHLPGAVNIPISEVSPTHDLPSDRKTPILVVCERGNVSIAATLYLHTLGYTNTRSIIGGTQAWTFELEAEAAETSK